MPDLILVDTSVWITHLREGETSLVQLLEQGLVACHPFIIGEHQHRLGHQLALKGIYELADPAEQLGHIERASRAVHPLPGILPHRIELYGDPVC